MCVSGMVNGRDEAQGRLRVLVVEDEPDTAASLAFLLKLQGYQAEAVGDGLAALEAARVTPPDVVLLDIGLPAMDGYELARRLRDEHLFKRPLLIAISGYGDESDRRRCLEAGIDLHL